MLLQQFLNVQNSYDIISARMHVREAARNAGMNPSDQARISLATSSLMQALNIGQESCSIVMELDRLSDGQGHEFRVVFLFTHAGEAQAVQHAAESISWMVDNIVINEQENSQTEITLTKMFVRR